MVIYTRLSYLKLRMYFYFILFLFSDDELYGNVLFERWILFLLQRNWFLSWISFCSLIFVQFLWKKKLIDNSPRLPDLYNDNHIVSLSLVSLRIFLMPLSFRKVWDPPPIVSLLVSYVTLRLQKFLSRLFSNLLFSVTGSFKNFREPTFDSSCGSLNYF